LAPWLDESAAIQHQAYHHADDDIETRCNADSLPGVLVHIFIGCLCRGPGLFRQSLLEIAQPIRGDRQVFFTLARTALAFSPPALATDFSNCAVSATTTLNSSISWSFVTSLARRFMVFSVGS